MIGCGVLTFSPLVVNDANSVVVGDDADHVADVDAIELDFVVDLACLFYWWGDVPAPGGVSSELSGASVFAGEPGDEGF